MVQKATHHSAVTLNTHLTFLLVKKNMWKVSLVCHWLIDLCPELVCKTDSLFAFLESKDGSWFCRWNRRGGNLSTVDAFHVFPLIVVDMFPRPRGKSGDVKWWRKRRITRILRKDGNFSKMRRFEYEFIHTNHHGALYKSISLAILHSYFKKNDGNCVGLSPIVFVGGFNSIFSPFFSPKIPFCPTQSGKLKISGFPGFQKSSSVQPGTVTKRDNGYETTNKNVLGRKKSANLGVFHWK